MAIKRKRNQGITLRSRRHSTEKENFRRVTTEIWEGPFKELLTKQNSVAREADSTNLTPTEADHGSLEIVTSRALETGNPRSPGSSTQQTIEIEWVELRKKLETHPLFADVSDADRRKIASAIDSPDPNQSPALTDQNAIQLYTKLLRGQTEYSMAVPVVRRTTHRPSKLDAQGAWKRDDPPVSVPGGWDWLKTADRITMAGRDFNRVEEWTAAEQWDTDIYS